MFINKFTQRVFGVSCSSSKHLFIGDEAVQNTKDTDIKNIHKHIRDVVRDDENNRDGSSKTKIIQIANTHTQHASGNKRFLKRMWAW
jgi:hypothetical protein